MADLMGSLRTATRPRPGARHGDFWWIALVGGGAALILGWILTFSLQAACAMVLVLAVIGFYQHDRRWGIGALFALWFVAPGLRRVFGLYTGYVDHDPLSLAPFLATGAVGAMELLRVHVQTNIRRILLVAAAGFAIGLPVGLAAGPTSAIYAFIAYLAAVSGAAMGLAERTYVNESTLRNVLLFGMPPIAAYAVAQRVFPLPSWDKAWVDATKLTSLGVTEAGNIHVFASLNHPGTLAPLLVLSLLCYLTVHRVRTVAVLGAVLITVALALTFVRSSWVALIAGGLAHVFASGGRSGRVVFTAMAAIVLTTLALAPVSNTAYDVLNRFETIAHLKQDTSTTERQATVRETLPGAVRAPIGHGLGTAGEATKLSGNTNLRAPDNGYLALIYQVGPVGFLMVMVVIAYVLATAWDGARSRAPGQEVRQLLFAMLACLIVLLWAGDGFYGSVGVIFWFIAGQVLGFQERQRQRLLDHPAEEPARNAAVADSGSAIASR